MAASTAIILFIKRAPFLKRKKTIQKSAIMGFKNILLFGDREKNELCNDETCYSLEI